MSIVHVLHVAGMSVNNNDHHEHGLYHVKCEILKCRSVYYTSPRLLHWLFIWLALRYCKVNINSNEMRRATLNGERELIAFRPKRKVHHHVAYTRTRSTHSRLIYRQSCSNTSRLPLGCIHKYQAGSTEKVLIAMYKKMWNHVAIQSCSIGVMIHTM